MMLAALDVEWLKLRRSRVPRVAAAVLLLAPPFLAASFAIVAGRDGADPMTLKARAMLPGPGWAGYVSGLGQVFATAGLLGMGVVVAWCFGREFAERTVVSLYANATPRATVAAAKLTLLMVWASGVSVALGPTALLVGLAAGLGPPEPATLFGLGRIVGLAMLTGASALTVALFASVGRGYLPAIGGLLGLVVAAQVAVILGVGQWFPLSSPGLWATSVPGMPSVGVGHLALVPVFSSAMAMATVAWWRRAPSA